MFIVQIVEIIWTKATRGAPRSNERVALPRAFLLDTTPAQYQVQRYRMAEWESFRPTVVQRDLKPSIPASEDQLRIAPLGPNQFALGLLGASHGGQPRRHPVPEALVIQSGQFARLVVNARHTSYSGQWYSETVYNVAYGDDLASDRLLTRPPDHEFDLKTNLF